MKIKSSLVAAFLAFSLAESPSQAIDCPTSAWMVTAVAGGITALWLIPFSVAIAKGPYALEQYCPGNSGAFCCSPPTSNPTTAAPTTTTQAPNATATSTASTTPAPPPSDCIYQTINYGDCGAGKVLYCPNQPWPAALREKAWVNGLMIASSVFVGIFGATTAVSFIVASIGTCMDMC